MAPVGNMISDAIEKQALTQQSKALNVGNVSGA
jgi:hypothetical protein